LAFPDDSGIDVSNGELDVKSCSTGAGSPR
jgi:hypothetical protein